MEIEYQKEEYKKINNEDQNNYKSFTIEEMNNLYKNIRKKSKKGKIGLMYSKFDITDITEGKENEYEWCKNLCDILIMCIKITPEKRTILNIDERIKYAEKSGYFDYILMYETNEDIENYIKYLEVNILIKGYFSYHYIIKNKK